MPGDWLVGMAGVWLAARGFSVRLKDGVPGIKQY
jgi:hypothetical protein